ncbi:hypothetical protein EVAR_15874_1 [Eumeta japonica]|uniref:Uncharacterized protein n=1 Tax=Eumeta variegata TaxID=151549 RepID=A0A4C1UE69_EUMVA|nr:hypothetical protein EVAR_15874_1 [Eumeta japonica]
MRVWDTVRTLSKTSTGSLGAVLKKPIARDGSQIAEKKIVMQPADGARAGHVSVSVRRDSIHRTSRVSQRSKGRVALRSARGRGAKYDLRRSMYTSPSKTHSDGVQTAPHRGSA